MEMKTSTGLFPSGIKAMARGVELHVFASVIIFNFLNIFWPRFLAAGAC